MTVFGYGCHVFGGGRGADDSRLFDILRAATQALEAAHMPWRVVFTSPSLSGLWAAVAAGIGISLRTLVNAPPSLRVLGPESGLPTVPAIPLLLVESPSEMPSPVLQRFKEILLETCRLALGPAARTNSTGSVAA